MQHINCELDAIQKWENIIELNVDSHSRQHTRTHFSVEISKIIINNLYVCIRKDYTMGVNSQDRFNPSSNYLCVQVYYFFKRLVTKTSIGMLS